MYRFLRSARGPLSPTRGLLDRKPLERQKRLLCGTSPPFWASDRPLLEADMLSYQEPHGQARRPARRDRGAGAPAQNETGHAPSQHVPSGPTPPCHMHGPLRQASGWGGAGAACGAHTPRSCLLPHSRCRQPSRCGPATPQQPLGCKLGGAFLPLNTGPGPKRVSCCSGSPSHRSHKGQAQAQLVRPEPTDFQGGNSVPLPPGTGPAVSGPPLGLGGLARPLFWFW